MLEGRLAAQVLEGMLESNPHDLLCRAFCVWQTSLDQECSNREGQSSHLRSKI